jgi:multidrug efflux pump subunit AcrA (membrane-fusion protein)
MYKNLSLILIAALTASALLISCKDSKKESKKDEETIFAVNTTLAVKGEIKNFIELNGDIKTKNEAAIYPDVMGKVVSITVKLGDNVYRNQIIAYVDPSKPGMDYNASPVRSTLNGTITSLPVDIGSTVSPQTAIAKVGQLDKIEIITNVAEKYINKIKIGLPAIVRTQAFQDKTFKAEVSEISPVVDPITRMMEVRLKLTDPNSNLLKPGMFAELKIITDQKENIVKIPAECIVKRYGLFYVFVVKRESGDLGVVEKRKITSGIQIENKVEILEGLQPEEEIVYSGQTLLEDKAKVKIIESYLPLTVKDVVE